MGPTPPSRGSRRARRAPHAADDERPARRPNRGGPTDTADTAGAAGAAGASGSNSPASTVDPAGASGSTLAAGTAPRARGRRWRLVGLAALVILLGAAGLLVRDVVRIRHDLTSGQDLLSHLQLTQLDSRATIDATLGKADHQLRDGANLTRDSVWLKLLTTIPKVGPQIRAARVLSRSAAQVGDIAYGAAVKARGQLDAPRSGPADRLRLIDTLRQDMAEVSRQLAQVHTHTDGHLTKSLAKAHTKLVTKLAQSKTQLADGMAVTATLRTMLAGPRTYLVLAGNNAEMRSGGITTAAGLIHFEGGDMTTGPFISSFDLFLPDAKAAAVPPEIAHLYGWMSPGQEWRTTDTSPNWPAVAAVYAQMSANSPFGKVDGVLFVDVLTLQSVLKVVGPVSVNGFTYNAGNVVAQVLYYNYLLFPTAEETNARRDVQSKVARAAFSALRGGSFSLPQLAKELQGDAKGRHLLAWSADPGEEAMWAKVNADGAIGPDDLIVSIQNVSASKLDLFLQPVVTIDAQHYSDHQEVNLYVTVTNPRRGPTSAYIEGGTDCCVLPGDQRIMQLYYLPASAYNITSYKPEFSTVGTDGGMTVVGVFYIVPFSETRTVHISFFLPPSQTSVTLLPSSRVKPVPYVINGLPASDVVVAKIPI